MAEGFPGRLQFTGPSTQPSPYIPQINTEHFYRYDNLPIKIDSPDGRLPFIHRDAQEHEDFQQQQYPKIKTLRLWVPEDLVAYEAVMTNIGKGHAEFRYEIPQYVPEQQNWVVLLAWIDLVLELPKNAPVIVGASGENGNGSGQESGVTVHR